MQCQTEVGNEVWRIDCLILDKVNVSIRSDLDKQKQTKTFKQLVHKERKERHIKRTD